MNTLEIARRCAELGNAQDACRAYTLALQEDKLVPEEEMEAAVYILQMEGDYKVAYTSFRSLYDRGLFQEDCLDIMTQAFYQPNIKLLKSRYEKNCKALEKYPYLFRKDFLDFAFLPIRFYPFDDNGYLPFYPAQGQFDDYVNPNHPVVSRNFFHDLENPILAKDVYSQYELEYLNDNVRPSEWVGRENHIYLHYTDWGEFCSHLQVLNMRELLKDKKIVFLIGEEIAQYPLDFQERFGIDYSQYPVKPIGIREVNRLIWHTQLATHNGGDFFNEIFDGHPNLIAMPSVMMEKLKEEIEEPKKQMALVDEGRKADTSGLSERAARVVQELVSLRNRTDKDFLVAICMYDEKYMKTVDHAARIAPALFLQPHFGNLSYQIYLKEAGYAVLHSKQYDEIQTSPIFQNFKYIKTFTPMRRITGSYGATVRFVQNRVLEYQQGERDEVAALNDNILIRVLNRSYMIDPQDRLYQDSILVRFEDGKLNPKAVFTALAAFLDLPYTESMTYCTLFGERDPESLKGNDLGFSPAAIYRTYDEYTNDAERAFIEYFMRDAYTEYGYDFLYYDGQPVDEARVNEWIDGFTTIEHYIRTAWRENVLSLGHVTKDGQEVTEEEAELARNEAMDQNMKEIRDNWHSVAKTLLGGLHFVNKNGQPLRMMPKLELDPALLEQPLYH